MAIDKIEESIEKRVAERATSVEQTADKLIAMKNQVDKIEDEMDVLKQRLKPIAENGVIRTDEGSIVYVNGSVSTYVTKDNVKTMLMEKLNLSESMAIQLIEAGASEKIMQSYVKVMSK